MVKDKDKIKMTAKFERAMLILEQSALRWYVNHWNERERGKS